MTIPCQLFTFCVCSFFRHHTSGYIACACGPPAMDFMMLDIFLYSPEISR
jgi:hypothetical protein